MDMDWSLVDMDSKFEESELGSLGNRKFPGDLGSKPIPSRIIGELSNSEKSSITEQSVSVQSST